MLIYSVPILTSIAAAFALLTRHLCIQYVGIQTVDSAEAGASANESRQIERTRVLALLKKLGSSFDFFDSGEARTRKTLIRAGMNMDSLTWNGVCIICLLIFVSIGICFAILVSKTIAVSLICVVAGTLTGLFAPQLYLAGKKRKRDKEIAVALPSALELLNTAVHAGYPLERGIRLVGKSTTGVLSQEFQRIDKEINYLNMPLDKSFERLKDRCDTPGVTYFANAMIQAYRQGTSISRLLDAQAKAARNEYYTDVLVQINQLPNKMIPVIFVVFFPIIIVLSVAPVVYNAVVQFMSIM